jgi:hypothetical protein
MIVYSQHSCSNSLDGGVSQVVIYIYNFYSNELFFDWPITQNKLKLWQLPKIEVSFRGESISSPWPTYFKVRKGENFGQSIWNKSVVLLGTWEPLESFLGTNWEQETKFTSQVLVLNTGMFSSKNC